MEYMCGRLSGLQNESITQNGEFQNELYTPPLYTSVFGYKYCLKIMLNGDMDSEINKYAKASSNSRDEAAERTSILERYIGIYLILMKGDFDEMLMFPPNLKCRVSILDQSPLTKHITKVIYPENKVPFQKPERDMNPPVGFPLFASRAELLPEQGGLYVVDDVLFIKSEMLYYLG